MLLKTGGAKPVGVLCAIEGLALVTKLGLGGGGCRILNVH